MTIIKLHSTSSTNDYLKELVKNQLVENYTVVTAQNQENGRGQMGAAWHTEEGKNLIMSIYVKNVLQNPAAIFHLNRAISVAVYNTLIQFGIKEVAIKWPNDIMADNKKICGILIENTLKHQGNVESVIGIGLNVNQTVFDGLPKAISMAVASGFEWDIEVVLEKILAEIQFYCELVRQNKFDEINKIYNNKLFKKDVEMQFRDQENAIFKGIIKGVDDMGKLMVETDAKVTKSYALKEIELLY